MTKAYTFGGKSWNVVKTLVFRPNRWLGKFVSGTLNWTAKKDDEWVIFSFDLGTEKCGQVLMPDRDGDNVFILVLDVILLGCLFFVTFETFFDLVSSLDT
ncbi:hypothetical protein CR513_45328, partial [Mucuna pruriens]